MKPIIRVQLSVLATVIGWAAGFAYYLLIGSLTSALGWWSDAPAVAFWSGAFIAITWFVVVLPTVLALPSTAVLLRLPWTIATGALSGLIVFALLLTVIGGTELLTSLFYLFYAVVVGGTTSTVYAAVSRVPWHNGG